MEISEAHTHTHTHTHMPECAHTSAGWYWREGDKRDIGQGEDREREREKHLLYSL